MLRETAGKSQYVEGLWMHVSLGLPNTENNFHPVLLFSTRSLLLIIKLQPVQSQDEQKRENRSHYSTCLSM